MTQLQYPVGLVVHRNFHVNAKFADYGIKYPGEGVSYKIGLPQPIQQSRLTQNDLIDQGYIGIYLIAKT